MIKRGIFICLVILSVAAIFALGNAAAILYMTWQTAPAANGLVAHSLFLGIQTLLLIAGIIFVFRWLKTMAVSLRKPSRFELRILLFIAFLPVLWTTLVEIAGGSEIWRLELNFMFAAAVLSILLLWTGYLVTHPPKPSPTGRWTHRFDVLTTQLLFITIGTECCLMVLSNLMPTPVLYNPDVAMKRIQAHRMKPGFVFWNFPCNSRGYYDDEFTMDTPRDLTISVLADSFGFGIVPHEYNFTTVAESRLAAHYGTKNRFRSVAVDNYGVISIEPAEYAYILEAEVLRTRPDLVVLSIFIGNDITGIGSADRHHMSFRNWLIWQVPVRLAAFFDESSLRSVNVRAMEPCAEFDPADRTPTFTQSGYMHMELDRLEACNVTNPASRKNRESFFNGLDYFRNRLGKRLVVLLIPDEYQVRDDLWSKLTAIKANSGEYDREMPQSAIHTYCRRFGIPVVDPLDELRKAERIEPTYQTQDTHWNAHGNRIAGNILADVLIQIVDTKVFD